MDENQKDAIRTLNRLLQDGVLDESEYFTLLGFVVEEKTQVTYVPPQQQQPTYPAMPTFPFTTWRNEPFKYEITCQSLSHGASSKFASKFDKENK